MSSRIRQQTLPNGVRVITERIESVRSCGIGLLLDVGSRHESPEEAGLSHFIEHLLFKGTPRYDAKALADRLNYLGGNTNAYTTQETLVLHARTVEDKTPAALEVLAEMLLESTFPPEEVRRERQVILEEWKMVEDNPDEAGVDRFMENLWPGHPLGRPVIGRRPTIRTFGRDSALEYWHREFRPDRLVVAVAGSFDAGEVRRVIQRTFGRFPAATRRMRRARAPFPATAPGITLDVRPIEQAHLCLGTAGPGRDSEDRYAFGLLNMILGGGFSSRLFQEVREQRGLAYSIGSFAQIFSDRGLLAVNGASSEGTIGEVLRITLRELIRICEETASETEVELARAQIIDAMLISLENTESRTLRLGESLLAYGRVMPVDEVIGRIRRVTPEEIRRVGRKYLLKQPFALTLMGPGAARRALLREPFGKYLRKAGRLRLMDVRRDVVTDEKH